MAQMFGKATVNMDGAEIIKAQDAKLTLSGVKRNPVKGNDVYGYAEEAMEASVEVNAFVAAATDLDLWNNASDVTILFSCDSGQQYVLAHAWLESPPELTEATDGGKVTLKFDAVSAEKV